MGKYIDLTGQRFGRLTVSSLYGKDKHKKLLYRCVCDCGNETIVSGNSLKKGNTRSCGCLHHDAVLSVNASKTSHGLSKTPIYKRWTSMKDRCYNEKTKAYKDYGGRGITVCDEWRNDFEAFLKWAIDNGYRDDLTIDRIDVNGNYEPSNCRLVTMKEQANNRRSNNKILYDGKLFTLAEWSEIIGIPYHVLYDRIKVSKWSFEKAITTEYKPRKKAA